MFSGEHLSKKLDTRRTGFLSTRLYLYGFSAALYPSENGDGDSPLYWRTMNTTRIKRMTKNLESILLLTNIFIHIIKYE